MNQNSELDMNQILEHRQEFLAHPKHFEKGNGEIFNAENALPEGQCAILFSSVEDGMFTTLTNDEFNNLLAAHLHGPETIKDDWARHMVFETLDELGLLIDQDGYFYSKSDEAIQITLRQEMEPFPGMSDIPIKVIWADAETE